MMYVYILKCSDNTYYTGVTNNIERRLYEHNEGLILNCYTHPRRPVILVFSETFPDPISFLQALARKAGLEGDAWRESEAELLRYRVTGFGDGV